MTKFLYIIIHVLILLLFLLFVFSVFGMIYGSLEVYPTEEQQEKVRISYGVTAFSVILLEFMLTKARSILKKKIRKC